MSNPIEAKLHYIDRLSIKEAGERLLQEFEELTAREREVVKLVAEGHSNKIIADKLDISDHTAKFHVGNLMKKFNANSRAEVAAMAVRMGLA